MGDVGVGDGVEGGREEDGAEGRGKGGGTTEVADLASRKVEIGTLRAWGRTEEEVATRDLNMLEGEGVVRRERKEKGWPTTLSSQFRSCRNFSNSFLPLSSPSPQLQLI